MFGSLPGAREGEPLYSVLARFGRYLNAGEAGPLMTGLLGRRHAIASVDLPGNLAALVRSVPESTREETIDRVIDELTAFPFHTAFAPAEVRDGVRRAMRGDVTGIYTRLGLATFKVRPPERLRFCPECLDAMERERGDLWWRREHQLPGVPVCAVHGAVLRLSDVVPGDLGRHTFVPATREVCRADAEPAVTGKGGDLERLADLARAAAALLDTPRAPRSYDLIMEDHRAALARVGLMRSARKVDHAALLTAFRRHWGGLPEIIPGLELGEDHERSWLAALVRNGRRAVHPLQHLMLELMVAGMDAIAVDRPFGSGPWACRNPLADHHGEAVIRTVEVRRNRGAMYGDFACACGYLYTVGISVEGVVGQPRYRRFGPLLAPAIRVAVERGHGLRRTASAVGLDPKTLIREAAMAGVAVPWSTAASGRVPVAPSPAIAEPTSRRDRATRRRPRRNWLAIDARLARAARAAASAIAGEVPPVRVTAAEVERRIARPDWIVKRRAKLSRTVEAMANVAEGIEAFRRRRLAWCVGEAIARGDLRPCEVLRTAGLPMAWLPEVREALATAGLRGRAAA